MKSNGFLKITALFTSLCLIAEQSWAALPAIPVTPPSFSTSENADLWSRKDFPAELGSIEEFWTPESTAGKSSRPEAPEVLLIQDAHGQVEAQRRTALVLDYLNQKTAVDSLFIEGGVGELEERKLSLFKEVPLNSAILDSFLKQGEIGGAELFLWNAGKPRSLKAVFGLEEPALFVKGVRSYRSVSAARAETEMALEHYAGDLDRRASRTLRPELFRLVREWGAYERRQTGFSAYLNSLSESALQHLKLDLSSSGAQLEYPMMVRLSELHRREMRLDHRAADEERRNLAAWCRRQPGLEPGFAAYLETTNFRKSAVPLPWYSLRNFWEQFYLGSKTLGFHFQDYPALALEEGFRILESEMDAQGLFQEMDHLRERVLETLGVKPEEKELLEQYRRFLLLQKLLSLNLTFSEFAQLQKNEEQLRAEISPELVTTFREALDFYETASRRDRVMAENLARMRSERGLKHSIVVAGGFHTEGLRIFLKEHGLSFAVIRPHLSEIESPSVYEAAMTDALPSRGLMEATSRVANFLNTVEQWRRWGLPMDRRAAFMADAYRWGEARGGTKIAVESRAAAEILSSRGELRTLSDHEQLLEKILDSAATAKWGHLQWVEAFRQVVQMHFPEPPGAKPASLIAPPAAPRTGKVRGQKGLDLSVIPPDRNDLAGESLLLGGGVFSNTVNAAAVPGKPLSELEKKAVELAAKHLKHPLEDLLRVYERDQLSDDLARSYLLEHVGIVNRILKAWRQDAVSGIPEAGEEIAAPRTAEEGLSIMKRLIQVRERNLNFADDDTVMNAGLTKPEEDGDIEVPFSALQLLTLRKAGYEGKTKTEEMAAFFDPRPLPVRNAPDNLIDVERSNPIRSIQVLVPDRYQPPFLAVEYSRSFPGRPKPYLRVLVLKEPLSSAPQDYETTDDFIRNGFEDPSAFALNGSETPEVREKVILELRKLALQGRLLIQDTYEMGKSDEAVRRYALFSGRSPEETQAIEKSYRHIQNREMDASARLIFATQMGLGSVRDMESDDGRELMRQQIVRSSAIYEYPKLRRFRESIEKRDFFSPMVSLLLSQTGEGFLIPQNEVDDFPVIKLNDVAQSKRFFEALAKVQEEIRPEGDSAEALAAAAEFRDVLAFEVLYRIIYETLNKKEYFRGEKRTYFWIALVNRAETLWKKDLTASRVWILGRQAGEENWEEESRFNWDKFWEYFLAPETERRGRELQARTRVLTLRDRQLLPLELPEPLRDYEERKMGESLGLLEKSVNHDTLVRKIQIMAANLQKAGIPQLIRQKREMVAERQALHEALLAVREHYETEHYTEALEKLQTILSGSAALLDEPAQMALANMQHRLEGVLHASLQDQQRRMQREEASALALRAAGASSLSEAVEVFGALKAAAVPDHAAAGDLEKAQQALEARMPGLVSSEAAKLRERLDELAGRDLTQTSEPQAAETAFGEIRAILDSKTGILPAASFAAFRKDFDELAALQVTIEKAYRAILELGTLSVEIPAKVRTLLSESGAIEKSLPAENPWRQKLAVARQAFAVRFHDQAILGLAAVQGGTAPMVQYAKPIVEALEGFAELQGSFSGSLAARLRDVQTPREAFLAMEGASDRLKGMIVRILETGEEKGATNNKLHREFFDYFLKKDGGATAAEKEVFDLAFGNFNLGYESIRAKARAGDVVTMTEKDFYEQIRHYGKETDRRGSHEHISLQPSKSLLLMATNMARILAGLAAEESLGEPAAAPAPSEPGRTVEQVRESFQRYLARRNFDESYLLYEVSVQAGHVGDDPAAGLDVSALLALRSMGLLASMDNLDIYRILYKHEIEQVKILPAYGANPPSLYMKLKTPYKDSATDAVYPEVVMALAREPFPMAPRQGETLDLFVHDPAQLEVLTFNADTEAGAKKIKLGALKDLALKQRFVPAGVYAVPYYRDTLQLLAENIARTKAEQWAITQSMLLGFNSGSSLKVQSPMQGYTSTEFQELVDFFREFGDPFAAYSHGAETRRKLLDKPVFRTMNANPTLRPLVRLMIRREGNDWLIHPQDLQTYAARLEPLARDVLNPAFPEIPPVRGELRSEAQDQAMVARFAAELGLAVLGEIYKKGLRHTPRQKLEARLLKEVEIETRASLAGFSPVTMASGRERDQKVRDAAAQEKMILEGFGQFNFQEAKAAAMRKALELRKAIGVRPVFFDFGSLEDFKDSMEEVLLLQQSLGTGEQDPEIAFFEQLVAMREYAEAGDFASALRASRAILSEHAEGEPAERVRPFYEAVRKAAMTEALGILGEAVRASESEAVRRELLRADALREVLELAGEEIRIFEDARAPAEEKAVALERLETQERETRAAALQAMTEALAGAATADNSTIVSQQLDTARAIHDTFNSKFVKAPLTAVEETAYGEAYESAETRGAVLSAQEKRKSELESARVSSVRGRELLEGYAARMEAEPELAEHFWALMRAIREAPDYSGLAAADKAGLLELEARVLRLLKGEPRQIADLLAQALEVLSLGEPRDRSREEALEREIAALDPENALLLHRRGEIEKARQAALDSMMTFLRQAAASDSVTEIEGLLSKARHLRESFNTSFPGNPLAEGELQNYQKGIESAEIRQTVVRHREALGRDLAELMTQPGVAAGLVVPYLNQAVALSDAVTQPELLGAQERLTWHLTRAALLLATEASGIEAAAQFAAALEILEKIEPRDSAREARLLAQIEALDPKNPVLLKRRMEGGRYETFRLILSDLEFAASARGLDVVQQAIAKAEALHENFETAFPDKVPADRDEAARQTAAREKRETQYKEAHAAAIRNREVEEARLSFETAWKYLTHYRDLIGDQTPDETTLEQVMELFSKAVDRPEYDAMSAEQSRDFHLFAGAMLSVEYLNDNALADAPAWEFDLALEAMEKLPVRDPARELETENKIGELDKAQTVYARRIAERTEKQERIDQLQVSVGEDIRVMTDRMDSIRARLEQMRRDLEGLQALGMTADKAAAVKAKIDGLELVYEEKAIGFDIHELVERSNGPRVQKPIAYFKSRAHGLSAKINLVRRFGKPGREAEARLLSKLSDAESQIRSELRKELAPVLAGTMIDGTFSPLQQMRSEEDWGIADFATMLREILLKARLGQRLAQVLPLNLPKAFNSPYSPKSSRLMDPLNIGIPGLLKSLEQEFGIRIPETEALMAGLEPEILRLRASGQVEHEAVLALKKKVLEAVWQHLSLHAAEPGYQSLFEEFQAFQTKNESWLEDHLLYQELLDEHTAKDPGKGWDWREWPEAVRDRDAAAMAALKIQNRQGIDFNKFLQFIADRQFRALKDQAKKLGISIMVDIPLAQDGADVWLQPEVFGLNKANGFRRQVSQGVPPDPFSDYGQYWQFFPYDFTNPATLQYIRDLYAFNQQRADYVRLDHVLGFYRQYFFTEDPGRAWTFEKLGLHSEFEVLKQQALAGTLSKTEAAEQAVSAIRTRLVQMRTLAKTGTLSPGVAPELEASLRAAVAAVPADAFDLLLDSEGRLEPDNMLAIFRSIPDDELDPVLDKDLKPRAETLAGLFLRTLYEQRSRLPELQGHFHHDSMTSWINALLTRHPLQGIKAGGTLDASAFYRTLRGEVAQKILEFLPADPAREPALIAFFEAFEGLVNRRVDEELAAQGFWKREYRAEPKTSEQYTPIALGVGEDKRGQTDPYLKYMENYLFPALGALPQKEDRLTLGYFRMVSNAETILSDLLRMSQEQGTVMIWEVLGVVPPKIQESVNRLAGAHAYVPIIWGLDPTAAHALYHPNEIIRNAYLTFGLHDSVSLKDRWEKEVSPAERKTVLEAIFERPRPYLERLKEILHRWGFEPSIESADLERMTPKVQRLLLLMVYAPWLFMDKPEGRENTAMAVAMWNDLLGLGSAYQLNMPGQGMGQWRNRLPPEITVENLERALDVVEAQERGEKVEGVLPPQAALDVIRLIKDLQAVRYEFGKRGKEETSAEAVKFLRADPEPGRAVYQLRQTSPETIEVMQPFRVDAYFHANPSELTYVEAVISGAGLKDPLHRPLTLAATGDGGEAGVLKYQVSWKPRPGDLAGFEQEGVRSYEVLLQYRTAAGTVHSLAPAHWVLVHDAVETNPLAASFGLQETADRLAEHPGKAELRVTENDLLEAMAPFQERMTTARVARVFEHSLWIPGGMMKIDDKTASNVVMAAPRGIYDTNLGDRNFTRDFAHVLMEKYGVSADRIRIIQMPSSSKVLFQRHVRTQNTQEFNRDFVILKVSGVLDAEGAAHDYYVAPQPHIQQAFLHGSPVLRKDRANFPAAMRARGATLEKPYEDRPHDAHQWISYETASGKMVLGRDKPSEGERVQVGLMVPDIDVENVTENIVHNGHVYMLETGIHGGGPGSTTLVAELSRVNWKGSVLHHEGSVRYTLNVPSDRREAALVLEFFRTLKAAGFAEALEKHSADHTLPAKVFFTASSRHAEAELADSLLMSRTQDVFYQWVVSFLKSAMASTPAEFFNLLSEEQEAVAGLPLPSVSREEPLPETSVVLPVKQWTRPRHFTFQTAKPGYGVKLIQFREPRDTLRQLGIHLEGVPGGAAYQVSVTVLKANEATGQITLWISAPVDQTQTSLIEVQVRRNDDSRRLLIPDFQRGVTVDLAPGEEITIRDRRFANWVTLRLSGVNRDLSAWFSQTSRRPVAVLNASTFAYLLSDHFPALSLQEEIDAESLTVDFTEVLRLASRIQGREKDPGFRRHLEEIISSLRHTSYFPDQHVWAHILDLAWKMKDQSLYLAMVDIENQVRSYHSRLPEKLRQLQALTAAPDRDQAGLAALVHFLFRPTPLPWTPAFRKALSKFLEGGVQAFGNRGELRAKEVFFIDHFEVLTHQSPRVTRRKTNWKLVKNDNFHKHELPGEDGEVRVFEGAGERFTFEIGPKHEGVRGRPLLITHYASGKQYFHPNVVVKRFGRFVAREHWVEALTNYGIEGEFADGRPFRVNAFDGELTYPGADETPATSKNELRSEGPETIKTSLTEPERMELVRRLLVEPELHVRLKAVRDLFEPRITFFAKRADVSVKSHVQIAAYENTDPAKRHQPPRTYVDGLARLAGVEAALIDRRILAEELRNQPSVPLKLKRLREFLQLNPRELSARQEIEAKPSEILAYEKETDAVAAPLEYVKALAHLAGVEGALADRRVLEEELRALPAVHNRYQRIIDYLGENPTSLARRSGMPVKQAQILRYVSKDDASRIQAPLSFVEALASFAGIAAMHLDPRALQRVLLKESNPGMRYQIVREYLGETPETLGARTEIQARPADVLRYEDKEARQALAPKLYTEALARLAAIDAALLDRKILEERLKAEPQFYNRYRIAREFLAEEPAGLAAYPEIPVSHTQIRAYENPNPEKREKPGREYVKSLAKLAGIEAALLSPDLLEIQLRQEASLAKRLVMVREFLSETPEMIAERPESPVTRQQIERFESSTPEAPQPPSRVYVTWLAGLAGIDEALLDRTVLQERLAKETVLYKRLIMAREFLGDTAAALEKRPEIPFSDSQIKIYEHPDRAKRQDPAPQYVKPLAGLLQIEPSWIWWGKTLDQALRDTADLHVRLAMVREHLGDNHRSLAARPEIPVDFGAISLYEHTDARKRLAPPAAYVTALAQLAGLKDEALIDRRVLERDLLGEPEIFKRLVRVRKFLGKEPHEMAAVKTLHVSEEDILSFEDPNPVTRVAPSRDYVQGLVRFAKLDLALLDRTPLNERLAKEKNLYTRLTMVREFLREDKPSLARKPGIPATSSQIDSYETPNQSRRRIPSYTYVWALARLAGVSPEVLDQGASRGLDAKERDTEMQRTDLAASAALARLDTELFLRIPDTGYLDRMARFPVLAGDYGKLQQQAGQGSEKLPEPEPLSGDTGLEKAWERFRPGPAERDLARVRRPAPVLIRHPIQSAWSTPQPEKGSVTELVRQAIFEIQTVSPETEYFWIEIGPGTSATGVLHPAVYITGIQFRKRTLTPVTRYLEVQKGRFEKQTGPAGTALVPYLDQAIEDAGFHPVPALSLEALAGRRRAFAEKLHQAEQSVGNVDLSIHEKDASQRPLDEAGVEAVFAAFTEADFLAVFAEARLSEGGRRGPSLLELPFAFRSVRQDVIFRQASEIAALSGAPSEREARQFLTAFQEQKEFLFLFGRRRFRTDLVSYLASRLDEASTREAALRHVKKLAEGLAALRAGDYAVELPRPVRAKPYKVPAPEPVRVRAEVPSAAPVPTGTDATVAETVKVLVEQPVETSPAEAVTEVPETLEQRFAGEVEAARLSPDQGIAYAAWYLEQARELKASGVPDGMDLLWQPEPLLRHALNLLEAAQRQLTGLEPGLAAELFFTRALIFFEQGNVPATIAEALQGLAEDDRQPRRERQDEVESWILTLEPEHPQVLARKAGRVQQALGDLHTRYAAAQKRSAPLSELLPLENEILALDAGDHAVKAGRAVRRALQAVEALEARMNDMGEAEYWEAHAAARRGIFNLQEIGADDIVRDKAAVIRLYEFLILKLERDIARGQVPDAAALTARVEKRQQAIEKESLFRTDTAAQGRLKVRLMGTASQFKRMTEEKTVPEAALPAKRTAPQTKIPEPVKTDRPAARQETVSVPIRITDALKVDLADEQIKARALAGKWPANIPHQKFAGRLIGVMRALVQELAKEPVDVKRVYGLTQSFFEEWLAVANRNFSPGSVLKPLFEEVSTLSSTAQKKIETAAKSELRFNLESPDLWVRRGPLHIPPDVTLETMLRAQKILRRFWEGLGVAAPGDLQAGRFPAPLVHDRQLDSLMAGLTGTQNQYYLYYLPDFSASAAKAYLAADFLDAYFENPSKLSEVKYLVAGASGNMGRAAAEFALSLKRHPDYAPYAKDLKVVVFAPSHLNAAKREKLLSVGAIVVDHAFSPEELDRYLGADADQRREILAVTTAPVFENDQAADAAAVSFAEQQGVSARPMRQGSAMGIAAYSVLMFEALDQWYRIQHAEAGHAEVPASAADLAAFAGFVAQDASFQNVRFWIPAGSGTLASGFAQIKQFNEWVEVLVAQSSGADHLLESLKHGSLLPREDFAFDAAAYPMVDSVGSAAEDASFRSLQGMADAVMRVPYQDLGLMTRLVRGLNLTFLDGDHHAAVAADFPAFLPLANAALARRFGILYPRLLRPGRHVIIPVPGGSPDEAILRENDTIDFAGAFDRLQEEGLGPKSELRLAETGDRRQYLSRFREGIRAVAREVTSDIFEVDYASELFREILAERAALDRAPFEMKDSEVAALAADYAQLAQRGAHVVLPAAAFTSLSDKALQAFFEVVLRGAQKAPAALLPRLYFAGAGARELKAKFFTYEVLHQARAGQIFQVQLQEESVIANRLRSRPSSVSVVKVPAEDSPLALEIPAFFIQSDEIRRLGEADKVRYLTRLSQLQLLAAEELKDQLLDPRPEQVRRVLGEFLAKVGIDYTQGPGGFLAPSQASLLSNALSQYLAANRATAKAA